MSKYTDWVKTLDCCHCGAPADDPHHAIGYGFGKVSGKAVDLLCMPLCRPCHNMLHTEWMGDKEMLLKAQMRWLDITLTRALIEGVIKI